MADNPSLPSHPKYVLHMAFPTPKALDIGLANLSSNPMGGHAIASQSCNFASPDAKCSQEKLRFSGAQRAQASQKKKMELKVHELLEKNWDRLLPPQAQSHF